MDLVTDKESALFNAIIKITGQLFCYFLITKLVCLWSWVSLTCYLVIAELMFFWQVSYFITKQTIKKQNNNSLLFIKDWSVMLVGWEAQANQPSPLNKRQVLTKTCFVIFLGSVQKSCHYPIHAAHFCSSPVFLPDHGSCRNKAVIDYDSCMRMRTVHH